MPARRIASTPSCSSPRASYIDTSARTSTASPSRGAKSTCWLRPRNITQRICARASLSEKYQWPLAARVKFEISPRTQASGKLRSSTPAIAWFSSLTGITSRVRAGMAGGRLRGTFSKSGMAHGRTGGVEWTCPQHTRCVKWFTPRRGDRSDCRIHPYKPLILMRNRVGPKNRQCKRKPYASTTYGQRPHLVHKVIHRSSG
ncbi:hypothetical protein D3C87_1343440 [compost metagenome]